MRRAASGLEGAWRMRERGGAATRTRLFGLSALLRNGGRGRPGRRRSRSERGIRPTRPTRRPAQLAKQRFAPSWRHCKPPVRLALLGSGGKRELRKKGGFAAAAQNGSSHAPAGGITLRARQGVWLRCGGMWSGKNTTRSERRRRRAGVRMPGGGRKSWYFTTGWRSPCAGLSGGVEIFAAEHGAAAVCAA